jgi:hypothetical protein
MWNVDPLLGNDHEMSNFTTAVMAPPKDTNRRAVFSKRSLLRCYKSNCQSMWSIIGLNLAVVKPTTHQVTKL